MKKILTKKQAEKILRKDPVFQLLMKLEGGFMTLEKIKVLKMIANDMENDAKNFDGRPFNGKTVAEYFGNQGAAIAALANIIKLILEKGETS